MIRCSLIVRMALCAGMLPVGLSVALAEKQTLRYAFKKDASASLVMATVGESTLSVMGKSTTVPQAITYHATVKVAGVDAEGNGTVSVVYDRVLVNFESPVVATKFDSAAPPEENTPLTQAFAGLVGKEVRLVLTPRGEIRRVEGMKELADGLFDPSGYSSDQASRAAKDFVDKALNEDTLRDMMGLYAAILPAEPVEVGDTWKSTVTTTKGMPFVADSVYTLKEVTADAVTIGGTSIVRTNESAEPIEFGGTTLTYKADGNQEFTATIPLSLGVPTKASQSQDISGEMAMKVPTEPPAVPQTFNIPVRLKSKTEIVARGNVE